MFQIYIKSPGGQWLFCSPVWRRLLLWVTSTILLSQLIIQNFNLKGQAIASFPSGIRDELNNAKNLCL